MRYIKHLSIIIVLQLVSQSAVNAQVEITGVPFLQIEPTSQGMLTGGAGSASPSEHPSSFFYNPAHLGYTGYHENISWSGFFHKMEWLPGFTLDMTYSHWSAAGGINLADDIGVPLSVGMGYQRVDLDLGSQFQTDPSGNIIGEFNSKEGYDKYGIGLHLDYPVSVSLGYARKHIISQMGPYEILTPARAFDAGVMLGYTHELKPFDVRVSTSYVIRNVGDEIQYRPDTGPDPLPRKAVWGYELSAGYTMMREGVPVRFIQADWTLEAQDILVESYGNRQPRYSRWPGDISFIDNVILAKDDEQVTVRRGARIHLMEAVTVGLGSFKGPGWQRGIRTIGYSISSHGMLNLLDQMFNRSFISGINDRINISYNNTRLRPRDSDHPLSGTKYQDISVQLMWR